MTDPVRTQGEQSSQSNRATPTGSSITLRQIKIAGFIYDEDFFWSNNEDWGMVILPVHRDHVPRCSIISWHLIGMDS